MIPTSRVTRVVCPKCQSQDTAKNGTVPDKDGRVQRLRCNHCKHIWNDPSFPRKPFNVAREAKSRPVGTSTAALSTSHSSPSPVPKAPNTSELKTIQAAIAHHRKLELDIPLDWSPMGLLNFTRAAQQNVLEAATPFGQAGQAELEWEALSPTLKAYVRARQHLDFALLLQLSSVFAAPEMFGAWQPALSPFDAPPTRAPLQTASLEPIHPTRASKTALKVQTQKQAARKPIKQNKSSKVKPDLPKQRSRQSHAGIQAESSPANYPNSNSSANTPTDEPERASWLEALTAFQQERQQWSQEREQLQRNLRDLEQTQNRSLLKITSVTHDFERLKKQVLEVKPTASPANLPSTATATSSESTHHLKTRPFTRSSSKRVMPPKYTASEEANLERLSNSLMANLVRLEGHEIRPRDIPHLTGERGPWKAVIEHLMTLGKIQHQGEFIAITLVERLRRGLQSSKAEPSN
jgi:hypothetical protein